MAQRDTKPAHYEVMVKLCDKRWVSYVSVATKAEAINWAQEARLNGYKDVKIYLRRP